MLREVAKHLRIHQVRRQIRVAGMAPDVRLQLYAGRVQIDMRQKIAGALHERRLPLQDLLLQVAWEALGRKAQLPLEQRDHRVGEIDLAFGIQHVPLAQVVGDHEQCHVADHLGSGRHFHDVAEQAIDLRVGTRDLGPAVVQSHGPRLLAQVCDLAARHLVQVHVRGRGPQVGFERLVQAPHPLPVIGHLLHRPGIHLGHPFGAGQRGDDRAQVRLRGQARHRIDRAVDRIGSGLDRRQHAGRRHARGVMRVEVDRHADFLLQRAHQLARRPRPAHAGHVLDAQDVCAGALDLARQLQVIVQTELGSARIEQVRCVAQRCFTQCAGFQHCIDGHARILDPVHRIEHAEQVNAVSR